MIDGAECTAQVFCIFHGDQILSVKNVLFLLYHRWRGSAKGGGRDFLESVQCSWPACAPGALVPGKGKGSEADPDCAGHSDEPEGGRWDRWGCPICPVSSA